MKLGFYFKLAIDGMRKNRRLYLPYILTSILMVAMLYIIGFLGVTPSLLYMRGGDAMELIMRFGTVVIGVFSIIFLIYTNSFLIRRRKKEFGLYNILGMDKKGITGILFCETIVVMIISLVVGVIFGVALSKLFELGLIRLIDGSVTYEYLVSKQVIMYEVLFFGITYTFTFIKSVISVRKSNTIDLVKSEKVGEKPPKGNWFLGLIGFVLLGLAYFIAVRIENPIDALVFFFFAVIMVIVATYLIFIAGSVLLCRILQKNKKYYYKKEHFVSLSSMVYRMKRNGAGLASICILLTMIIVTISSTTCLFFGEEDSVRTLYPRDNTFRVDFCNNDLEENQIAFEKVLNETREVLEKCNVTPLDQWNYLEANTSGLITDDMVQLYFDESKIMSYENILTVRFVPYMSIEYTCDKDVKIQGDDVIVYSQRFKKYKNPFNIGGHVFNVVGTADNVEVDQPMNVNITPNLLVLIDPDSPAYKELVEEVESSNKEADFNTYGYIGFNFPEDIDEAYAHKVYETLACEMKEISDNNPEIRYIFCNSQMEIRNEFYSVYGGFFFIGIMLSFVFLVAAVLIIYYKQISEGYEDQSRFEIMKKVGMTKENIKKSINSQMLTVFFLPIAAACVHMAFAFKMLYSMLLLFNLTNLPLLIATTIITVTVIAIIYTIVYKLTSNAYYSIVNDVTPE